MTAQMLVQIPILALAGGCLAMAVPMTAAARLGRWDRSGISGLVLASTTSLIWMLPRALDGAADVSWIAVAKFATVPLLIGFPFALSWPRMGFVVRGVFFAEAIATCFRLGWLFLASPNRLCSNYLLDDQQRLGQWLFAVGVGTFLALAYKLIAGTFDSIPAGANGRPTSGTGSGSKAVRAER